MLTLSSKKLLVVGLGKSGQAVAKRAADLGADVCTYEDTPGTSHQAPGTDFDLVVTSPGIRFNHPVLRLSAKEGWPVISEVEFAYQLLEPGFIIGITGTNGKTTVVEMLSHFFKLSGKPYTLAGNVGTPLSAFEEIKGPLILELSSFQLHFIDKFRANIGAILNVTEDHLDWHCCMGQYLKDKLRLFENQQQGDVAIVNGDDAYLGEQSLPERALTFSVKGLADFYLKDGYLRVGNEKIAASDELRLKGSHNIANALAAAACAKEAGLDLDLIREGLQTFEGLKHRLQLVGIKNEVSFYNDSKSTNPDSTYKAIESFKAPLILIIGGRNKGNNFAMMKKYLDNPVKELVLYGEAAFEIKEQVGAGHISQAVEEAVAEAARLSKSGDTVLFSPGCASFDLFDNYAQRGDAFVKAVECL